MDDKTLTRLSLVIAVVGLISLVAAAEFAQPKKVNVSDIKENLVGQNVLVNGTVGSVSISDGSVFIALGNGNSTIDVIVFEQDAENSQQAYVVRKGDSIAVSGKVNFYRGKVEVVARSIERI